MRGDKRVLEFLNEQLTAELTAINQYFLHAKMQENWGYTRLADYTRSESIDEMRHAESLTDRILFLDGLPNYQRLGPLQIGQTVPEQFRADMDDRGRRRRPGCARASSTCAASATTPQREPVRDDPRRRGAPHRLPRDPARAARDSSVSRSTWRSRWSRARASTARPTPHISAKPHHSGTRP